MALITTIGHSNHAMADFLALLRGAGVDVVVDVRAVPHSRRFPHFKRKALAGALAEAGLGYRFMGDRLGGLKHRDDARSFEDVAARADFARALDDLVTLARTQVPALMCAEREPMDCHRTILVARHLRHRPARLVHIHADGRLEPHPDFEARLVAGTRLGAGKRPADAGPLFTDDRMPASDQPDADPVEAAYRERGARMAAAAQRGRARVPRLAAGDGGDI